MNRKEHVMVSLSPNERKLLKGLSEWLGCSKSRVVSMGLRELESVLNQQNLLHTSVEKAKGIGESIL